MNKSITFQSCVASIFSVDKAERYKQITGKKRLENLEALILMAKHNGITEQEINPHKLALSLVGDFDTKGDFAKSVRSEIELLTKMLIDREYSPPVADPAEEITRLEIIKTKHYMAELEFKMNRKPNWFDQMYDTDSVFASVVDEGLKNECE